jgi:fatty acid desaturase
MAQQAKIMTHREAVEPPSSITIVGLRPSDWAGGILLGIAVVLTVGGVALSLQPNVLVWLSGQVVLAITMVQWFALLHECGHETLLRTKSLHAPIGRVAAFFSFIPFYCWKRVHNRHHKWTGWQDVDPTTAALVPRPLSRGERTLLNICWRYWIPLFAVIYRINNFWHWTRLRSLFPEREDRRRLAISIITLLAAYLALTLIVGPRMLLRVTALASLLAFMIEELVILSQHTHLPQNLSQGRQVPPFPALKQEIFTRSLVFPRWLSALLLHIDAHELHHMYPFVPGYRLRAICYDTRNQVDWLIWITRARALPGETLIFHNRLETGADI